MDYAFANSECSSGCESGWTLYLEHSSSSFSPYSVAKKVKDEEDQENEDLSMVSDASSGPPHFHEEDEFCRAPVDAATLSNKRPNMKKVKENPRRKVQEQPSLLDDTASSPIFDYSEKNLSLPNGQASVENVMVMEYSQGYSTTQFEGRSTYQEKYDFFQSSMYANEQQQNQLNGLKARGFDSMS